MWHGDCRHVALSGTRPRFEHGIPSCVSERYPKGGSAFRSNLRKVRALPPASQRFQLRHHPRLYGRWPPSRDLQGASAKAASHYEDVLERIDFYPPRQIVLQTKHADFTRYRALFLTGSGIAKRLASFLESQLGRTVAEIGNTEIDL